MNLSELKIKKTSVSVTKIWKFPRTTQKGWFYHGTEHDLGELRLALSSLYSSRHLFEVSLTLSDSEGNDWLIKNEKGRITYFKNQKVNDDFSAKEIKEICGIKIELPKEVPTESHHYHLGVSEDGFCAQSLAFENNKEKDLKHRLEQHLTQMSQILDSNLKPRRKLSPKDYIELEQKIRHPLMQKERAEKRLVEISEKLKSFPKDIDQFLEQLSQQLDVMNEIHTLLSETPNENHINFIAKEILTSQDKIAEEMGVLGLEKLPKLEEMPDWQKAIDALCRVSILETFVNQTEEKTFKYHDEIKSISQNIEAGLNEEITLSKQLLSLNIALRKETANRQQTLELQKKTFKDKIKVFFFGENLEETEDQYKKIDQDIRGLDFKISSCEKETQDLFKKLTSHHNSLAKFHENQTQKLNQSKTLWSEFAKDGELNKVKGLQHLKHFIAHYFSLMSHKYHLQILKDLQSAYMQRIEKISTCLKKWYALNACPPPGSFSDVALILSEARNMLRYKKEKIIQFHQLKSNYLKIATLRNEISLYENEIKSCQETLKSALQEFKIPVFSDEILKQNLDPCLTLRVYRDVLDGLSRAPRENFPLKVQDPSLISYTSTEGELSYEQKLDFMRWVDDIPEGSFFLTNDYEMAALLRKTQLKEIEVQETLEKAVQRVGTVASSNEVQPVNSHGHRPLKILNQKTQSVLEILGAKNLNT